MKTDDIIITTVTVLAMGIVASVPFIMIPRIVAQEEPAETVIERAPFHGSFVCEYYGTKTSKIDDVVGYDVFDVGNNFGWDLTLADGVHMMFLQSADKFCYTVPTEPSPTE